MGRGLDLTGQRFGRLVALSATDKRADHGRSIIWKCQCDCGNLAEVPARRLVSGKVRSCGCLRRPPCGDLTGKRFGRLVVLGRAGSAGELGKSGKKIYWKCRCDCGQETVVSQSELQMGGGGTQSCGCLQRERTRQSLGLVEGTSATLLERNQGKLRRSNTSGCTGVVRTANGKWGAYISFQKKRYWLGRYTEKEDAIQARKRGEEMHEDFLEWYHTEGKGETEQTECPPVLSGEGTQ